MWIGILEGDAGEVDPVRVSWDDEVFGPSGEDWSGAEAARCVTAGVSVR